MAVVFNNAVLGSTREDVEDHVWASFARGYAAFGSPFVPCREDIEILENAVATHASAVRRGRFKVVILGVTPGVALMKWPAESTITAVDNSSAVIRALWPGDIPGFREARCAAWTAAPVQEKSCDVVVGDGSLNVCRFPGEVREVIHALSDLLSDNGMFACRCYVRPKRPESVDDVFEALFSAGGLSVDHFKMRLYMAMQRSADEGVSVREAAGLLREYGLDRRTMNERLGWSSAVIDPFRFWPNSDAIYSFPALHELHEVTGEFFEQAEVTYPAYELGHCCPTLVMRPKVAGSKS